MNNNNNNYNKIDDNLKNDNIHENNIIDDDSFRITFCSNIIEDHHNKKIDSEAIDTESKSDLNDLIYFSWAVSTDDDVQQKIKSTRNNPIFFNEIPKEKDDTNVVYDLDKTIMGQWVDEYIQENILESNNNSIVQQ